VKLVARVLLASLLALGGCSLIGNDPAPARTAGTTAFGGTDRAWLEITIAMDEELIPLLDMVPQRSGSSALQALSLQVKAFTMAELLELHRLRDAAGMPRANQHTNMPMPGLVTTEQLNRAAKLSGREFDAEVRKAIRDFLDQGEQLANSENQSGVEPQTRALAAQVLRTRQEAKSSLKSAP
jgi:Domain of unknown function (DUF305)